MNEMNGYNIVFRHDFPREYVILCASFFESDLTDSFAVFSLLTVADNMSKERKCEMKGTGKRILSVSLSVMMALGMPSGTFAATPDEAAAEEQKVDAKKEQESVTEPTAEPAAQPEEVKNNENTNAETKPEKTQPDVQVTKAELVETKEECLVTVYTDSDVYDQLYIGKKEDAEKTPVIAGEKDLNGKYKFQFAVSEEKLGSKLQIVPGIKESGEWYTKQDLFCQVPERTQREDSAKLSEKPASSEAPSTEPSENTLADGTYTVKTETNNQMFKVISTKLTVKNGKMEALIMLSGTGYDHLYLGHAEDVEANRDQWIKWKDEIPYTTADGQFR